MWDRTFEIVGVPRRKDARFPAHRQLDAALDDNPALLARVRQHLFAGVRIRRVALVQDRHAAFRQPAADQPELHRPGADIGKLGAREEDLDLAGEIQGEELRKRHGNTVEDLLQRGHRGTDPVLLDQRNEAVGDTRAFRQLALRQTVHLPDGFEVGTDVESHGVNYFKQYWVEIQLKCDWC